ncbi:MAG: ribosome-associated translation inhibitor RaiA [Verrucomicrobiaceae bacterium]|nr:MAG: ribosome-associated translation inhibitor RaiA [Verrucomicrobiaceae bacterium]
MNNNSTKRIPIHITAHNVSFSPALYDFVQKKIGAVARFANDVLAVEIVLRQNPKPGHERFSASARLALPGRDVHSSASSPDLYVAVGIVAGRLARRLRKRKTRLSKTFSVRSGLRPAVMESKRVAVTDNPRGFSVERR